MAFWHSKATVRIFPGQGCRPTELSNPYDSMEHTRQIVIGTPLFYSEGEDFWGRDAGLLARGFQDLGWDAILVARQSAQFPGGEYHSHGCKLRLASRLEMETPAMWKSLHPDMAVLFTWTLPRYESIRRAVLAATQNLAERMDTDGMRSPLLDPKRFFYLSWAQAMDRLGAKNPVSIFTVPAFLIAGAWMLRFLIGAPWLGAHSARVASAIPRILVESPVAAQRIERWLKIYKHTGKNILMCPHAVEIDDPPASTPSLRRNRVVAVGRWESFQKDYPTALRTAMAFLEKRTDYEFHFVGDTPRGSPVRERLFFHSNIPRREIRELAGTSKILFACSRYESFHLGAAEALCCGCSVVMNQQIPTSTWFATDFSGTVSHAASATSLTNALIRESECWDAGVRNPLKIASHWKGILAPRRVAEEIVQAFS